MGVVVHRWVWLPQYLLVFGHHSIARRHRTLLLLNIDYKKLYFFLVAVQYLGPIYQHSSAVGSHATTSSSQCILLTRKKVRLLLLREDCSLLEEMRQSCSAHRPCESTPSEWLMSLAVQTLKVHSLNHPANLCSLKVGKYVYNFYAKL